MSLLLLVDTSNVCAGHPDEHFITFLQSRKGKLLSKDNTVNAYIETHGVRLNGKEYPRTVRYSKCDLLISGSKCSPCVNYRDSLRKLCHRWTCQNSTRQESTSSKANFRYLKTPERKKRYTNLRTRLTTTEREVQRLKDKIVKLTKKDGISLPEETNNDFEMIMTECTDEVRKSHPANSFKSIFWEQQLEAQKIKNKRMIRWHPALIKWCLHLKFLSSGAYRALRSSPLLVLPSERTLFDYTHFVKGCAGFSADVNAQLLEEADIREDSEKDRYVVLMWDEMKIKEDLVFDKFSCELVGFVDCGSINTVLDDLEHQCSSRSLVYEERRKVATHVLMFMVRGIFSKLKFPYAQFPTNGASADELCPLVWEAVSHLESAGLKVVALTCDGASTNRKFFRMNGSGKKKLVYKTANPYSNDPSREIYFFSDVPHLLKTSRNCFSNSFAHSYSRGLWVSVCPYYICLQL